MVLCGPFPFSVLVEVTSLHVSAGLSFTLVGAESASPTIFADHVRLTAIQALVPRHIVKLYVMVDQDVCDVDRIGLLVHGFLIDGGELILQPVDVLVRIIEAHGFLLVLVPMLADMKTRGFEVQFQPFHQFEGVELGLHLNQLAFLDLLDLFSTGFTPNRWPTGESSRPRKFSLAVPTFVRLHSLSTLRRKFNPATMINRELIFATI